MNKDIIDLKWLVEHYATHEELIERINAIPTPPSPTKSELPSVKEMMHKIKMDMCSDIMKPKSDGQRYGEEDKFMLQRIRRYFLSKSAMPFEKDAYLFIDKLFQFPQSKEQEPKENNVQELLNQREIIENKIRAIDPKALINYELEQLQLEEPKGSECETCNGKQVRKENGNIIICGDYQ